MGMAVLVLISVAAGVPYEFRISPPQHSLIRRDNKDSWPTWNVLHFLSQWSAVALIVIDQKYNPQKAAFRFEDDGKRKKT